MFDCVFILFSRQQWLYQVTSSDPSGTSKEMDGTLHILQDSMFSEKKNPTHGKVENRPGRGHGGLSGNDRSCNFHNRLKQNNRLG